MRVLSHLDIDGNEIRNRYDPVSNEPSGFVSRSESSLSFNNTTRNLTISPVSTSFKFYFRGVLFEKASPESISIPTNTSGVWFFYYQENGTLGVSQTIWNLSQVIPVAYVLWNATSNTALLLGDERHGLAMDWATHEYLHNTLGLKFILGLSLSGYVLNSDAETNIQVGLSNGRLADEDVVFTIQHSANPTNPFEQILQKPANIPVFYLSGNPGIWVKDAATQFFFKNTTGGRVNYNQNISSTWQQTQCTNNYFVNYWICATNSIIEPIISIQGQQEYSDLDLAQAETFNSLSFSNFLFPEIKPLYRITLQTSNSFTNNPRYAVIRFVSDLRAGLILPYALEAPAISHNSLTNRDYFSSGHTNFQLLLASNTPPANPTPGMQWFNTNTGWNMPMYWDAVRNAWLSVETFQYTFGRTGTNLASQYLRIIDGNSSDVQTPTIPLSFVVVQLASATNAANTATFAVRTKNVTTGALSGDLVTLTQTNARFAVNTAVNLAVTGPVGLAAYVTGTGMNNPNFTIFIKFRWT